MGDFWHILRVFADEFLAGGITVALLLGTGIYFTVKTGFFQITGFRFICKNTLGVLLEKDVSPKSHGRISSFQAVTTALAGTMGVGNIAGVATALTAGGAGAVFWMWVSAFFGMITKYCEIFLAVKYREKSRSGGFAGGPMYYMEHGVKSKTLAIIFASLCVVCSATIGNLTQVNSVSTAMASAFSVPLWISGLFVTICTGLVIVGGLKRIGRVTEFVIPFISIIYICISCSCLYINRGFIIPAFSLIFRSAFSLKTAAGGFLGYGISRALKLGVSRGVFTNEAGLGSAPIAHAGADCKSPGHQAVWGIFEVFLDTIVVCTLTALVLLTVSGGTLWKSGLDGAPLTSLAFDTVFAGFGGKFIALSIIFYAVSAILGWYYYGEIALAYIFGSSKPAAFVYRFFFLAFILYGSVSELGMVWRLADIFVALMAVPNVIALIALRNEITLPK